ncbi:MAG TPA: hypothetical protein P5530_03485 [Candidatus Diapherotrites archaeon]|jgi:hypothetical protein|nr:hypothetical protein [Candidatus Diapherotrites archaeon]
MPARISMRKPPVAQQAAKRPARRIAPGTLKNMKAKSRRTQQQILEQERLKAINREIARKKVKAFEDRKREMESFKNNKINVPDWKTRLAVKNEIRRAIKQKRNLNDKKIKITLKK